MSWLSSALDLSLLINTFIRDVPRLQNVQTLLVQWHGHQHSPYLLHKCCAQPCLLFLTWVHRLSCWWMRTWGRPWPSPSMVMGRLWKAISWCQKNPLGNYKSRYEFSDIVLLFVSSIIRGCHSCWCDWGAKLKLLCNGSSDSWTAAVFSWYSCTDYHVWFHRCIT